MGSEMCIRDRAAIGVSAIRVTSTYELASLRMKDQHVSSISIQCNGAFRHDCMEREQVEAHTRYIRHVQQLDLNITVLAVHHHR